MHLIILLNDKLPDRPSTVQLIETFGRETVVDDRGNILAEGTSAVVEGSADEVAQWIAKAEGEVWITPNPMVGPWYTAIVIDGRITVHLPE